MALQHFYSRVPARVSMYNKADGFDTFAKSAELEREFVERELAPVYENKLSKTDVSVIRQNKMPCVYTQCCTRSGALLQNCISYMPLDYTGERSAYLSHSLIFTEDEKKQILSTREDNALNPALFVANIDSFQITAANASPDGNYPHLIYSPGQTRASGYLLKEMARETVESFLYAILYSICGKGRNVCFKLPGENAQLSQGALQIFNEVLSILPSQLRGSLSFASYVTDPAQYASYKLRGVSAEFPENLAKCVCIDMQTNLIIGVQHDEVVANKPLINFFYSLLENKAMRTEFLTFMERAAEAIPSLQSLNLKVLSNLVFLFQCSCGLFPEQEILPSDTAVYDYLCAYEKYRAALNEEYRMQVYRCLLRYPKNHLAIPKNIFAKVTRLYGAEPRAAKRIVMNVVLELIHTDIMRDKLFTFIRNNYRDEDADMKQIIMADLTRVFYGGFLQSPLLTFFTEQFAEESEEAKSLIWEKLLLSIRTPAVQGKILAFIDQHYGHMSDSHKDSFYNTFFEMLPECDALADMLVKLVNSHIESESETRKAELTERLTCALENNYRRKEHDLMPILADHSGFCRDLVIRLALGPWQSRKLRAEYIQLLCGRSAAEKTDALVRAFALVPELDRDSLLAEATVLYRAEAESGDLYLWLETAEQLQALPDEFADRLHEAVIEPAVSRTACDVFDIRRRMDGMALLEDYASRHPNVLNSGQYCLIDAYNRMIAAAERSDYPAVDRQLALLLKQTELLPRMAEHLAGCGIDPDTQTAETVLCLEILQSVLEDGTAGLGRLYRKRTAHQTADQVMTLLLSVCIPLGEAGPVLSSILTAPDSGLAEAVAAFVGAHGKGAHHWLRSRLPQDSVFGANAEETLRAQKKAGGSLLSKLFGRKK